MMPNSEVDSLTLPIFKEQEGILCILDFLLWDIVIFNLDFQFGYKI
jgi:hypothetical protein